MLKFEDVESSIVFALSFIIPLILPVYLHSFVFEKLFKQKKYFLYVLIILSIILIFGFLHRKIIDYFIKGEPETFFLLIFFIAMFTGFKYLKIGTKQGFQLQKEENKRIKAELDLLKSYINPHFLFNTLNNIYSLILDKDDKAAEVVLKLSGLMRYILDSSKQKFVTLNEECDFIRNYISLEEIRLYDRCKIEFNIEGNSNSKKIAPMMLIPFIENCFKHGIGANVNNNNILINIKIIENKMILVTENSIVLNNSKISKKQGRTGLENIKRRLDLIYPNMHSLDITENEQFFKIQLSIDL